MCKNPVIGRTVIFDWPKATRAICFHRFDFWSERFIFCPSLMLRIIRRTFLMNMPIATKKTIAKIILLRYTIFDFYSVCKSDGLYLTCFFPNNEKCTYRFGLRRMSSRSSWICLFVCSSDWSKSSLVTTWPSDPSPLSIRPRIWDKFETAEPKSSKVTPRFASLRVEDTTDKSSVSSARLSIVWFNAPSSANELSIVSLIERKLEIVVLRFAIEI